MTAIALSQNLEIPTAPRLHRSFAPLSGYEAKSYSLLPFRFLRLPNGRRLMTNLAGEYIILSLSEFED
jgi:hypothetical protein